LLTRQDKVVRPEPVRTTERLIKNRHHSTQTRSKAVFKHGHVKVRSSRLSGSSAYFRFVPISLKHFSCMAADRDA